MPRGLGGWLVLFGVTGGFSGVLRPASGTWGSAWAAGLVLALWAGMPRDGLIGLPDAWWLMLVGAVLASAINVALGRWIERHWQRKDPGAVVIDEVAGIFVTFIGFAALTPGLILAGFLLFRVFDVVKLPPCRRLERLPRGWGILLDDLVAGVYANVVLQVLAYTWLGGSYLAGGAAYLT